MSDNYKTFQTWVEEPDILYQQVLERYDTLEPDEDERVLYNDNARLEFGDKTLTVRYDPALDDSGEPYWRWAMYRMPYDFETHGDSFVDLDYLLEG